MGGGGAYQNTLQTASNSGLGYAGSQAGLAQQYAGNASSFLSQSNQLQQPLINYNQAIQSGDSNALVSAMGPQLGAVNQQTHQALANINNQTAPGAARDYARALTQQEQGNQISQLINQAFTGSLQSSAQLGAQQLSAGLQEQGATLGAYSGANQSLGTATNAAADIGQIQAQNKASTMGFLGDIVGAGATLGSAGIAKSDARLKENLEKVGELGDVNLYSFTYKWAPDDPQIGVIAQEIYSKYPDTVVTGGEDPVSDPWAVDYGKLVDRIIERQR